MTPSHQRIKLLFGLLIAFVIIVVGGRYILQARTLLPKPSTPFTGIIATSTDSDTKSNIQTSGSGVSQTSGSTTAQTTSGNNGVSQCSADLKKKTESDKTEYQKGSVLVRFKAGFTYDQAHEVLGKYVVSVANEADSKESYKNLRLITGVVHPGDEFTTYLYITKR